MLIWIAVILIAGVFGCFRDQLVQKRLLKGREERQAPMHEFYDFRDRITKMLDDPATMPSDFRDLLPLCRFADERYRKLWGNLEDRHSCEAFVNDILRGGEKENASV
jgi:hypothetical protein